MLNILTFAFVRGIVYRLPYFYETTNENNNNECEECRSQK